MDTENMKIFSFQEELQFWGLQIKEHMVFMYKGLVDNLSDPNTLKLEAAELHNSWHKILSCNQISKLKVMTLLNITLDYQIKVKKLIKDGIWIGWLSYSFVNHLISESNYFKDKMINPNYNMKTEINYWLLHHQTEIEASEKLLDPLETEYSEISKFYTNQVKKLRLDLNLLTKSTVKLLNLQSETIEILEEYLDQTEELKNGILTNTILTNISLPLINHVIREGERAIYIFSILTKK